MERLWAPWRIEYIHNPGKECFFCTALKDIKEKNSLIIEKKDLAFIIMNRYPYNNGHLLIAPTRHTGLINSLTDDEILQMHLLLSRAIKAINTAMKPQGYNIGINQGKVAGAGVVDHIHIHLVPRWQGDTNFMPVLGDTKVISEEIHRTAKRIKECLEKLKDLQG